MGAEQRPSVPTGGQRPPPAGTEPYECDCEGFRQKLLQAMCLRCLAAYTDGLPQVLQGVALTREMRRVASVLARRVKEDPSLGRIRINTRTLQASEGGPVWPAISSN